MPSIVLLRHWRSTTLRRTLPPTLKGIRQEIQSHLALHCWSQLWLICDTRDSSFHLLLFGAGGYFALQERLDYMPPFELRHKTTITVSAQHINEHCLYIHSDLKWHLVNTLILHVISHNTF